MIDPLATSIDLDADLAFAYLTSGRDLTTDVRESVAWSFAHPERVEITSVRVTADDPEPDCECWFDGDSADASGCPVHGVSSPAAERMRMTEAASEAAYWNNMEPF